MKPSHEIDYEIHGGDLQFVKIELDPGETVVGEAGAMMYHQQGIGFKTKLGDGTEKGLGKMMSMARRKLTKESIWVTHFTNESQEKKHVAFASEIVGKIIPIDLSRHEGGVICQKAAFLAAAFGTKLSIAFANKLGAGFFGGEGFILQHLTGDGLAFIAAGGTVMEERLEKGDKLMAATGAVVGFENSVSYSIARAGNLKTMMFGGEGVFLTTLKGPGTVWLQSLPWDRLAERILCASETEDD